MPNFSKLLDFFRDDSPYSTMRIAVFFIIFIFMPWFTYVWVRLSFLQEKLADIPESVQWIIGVTLGAKVAQKGVEVIAGVVQTMRAPSTQTTTQTTTQTNG